MKIIDQIRDEKLQYDINKEAAKISSKSSAELHEYEYLIGKEIILSNQQQLLEQAKFIYSPLGKAFEKQIRTIEDQGGKKIKAIQDQRKIKTIKRYVYYAEDSPNISNQKEIFSKLVDELHGQIKDLSKKLNEDGLIYRYKGNTPNLSFEEYDDAFNIIDNIQNGK